MGLPIVLIGVCAMTITGCSLLPGRYTYFRYEVTQEKEAASIGYIDFDFHGTDSGFGGDTARTGSPYRYIVAVWLPKRYPALTLKNMSFFQDGKELLKIESLNLRFITDSAIGYGENRFLYMNTDNQKVELDHTNFKILCEIWSEEVVVSKGDLPFSITKQVSNQNRHLNHFLSI